MRSLFIGLALLVLGMAIGFALARSLEVGPTRAAVVRSAVADRSAPATVERKNQPLVEPSTAARERAKIAGSPLDPAKEFDSALSALLDRMPRTDGDSVVSGRVVDEAGQPIAGATVMLSGPLEERSEAGLGIDSSFLGRGYDASIRLDPMMSWYVRESLSRVRRAGRTESSDDGTFEVDGLGSGRYCLWVWAEGYGFQPTWTAAGSPIEIVGRRVASFTLDVVRADGSIPERALILLHQPNGTHTPYSWTPASPELRVTSGTVTVQALVGEVTRVSGSAYRGEERSAIRTLDRVVDGEGPHRLEVVGYPSVRVEVVAGPDAAQPFEPWCELVRDGLRIPAEGKNGAPFTALDVTAGPYTVEVGRGDGPAEVTREIVVADRRVDVRIELGPLDPARFLIVTCVDATGRPIQDVDSFGLSILIGRKSIGTSIQTKARPGGEYWLSFERRRAAGSIASRSEITSLELTARSRSRGRVIRAVDPLAGRVELVFDAPCELVVDVVGALDARLRARVEVPPGEGQQRWRSVGNPVHVPGDGSVAFTGLAPGAARVVAFHQDAPYSAPLVVREVDLLPGANRVRIEVTPTHDLVVLVPDRAGGSFELQREKDGSFERLANQKADDTERIVFENLAPGRYRLRLREGVQVRLAEYDVPCAPAVFEPTPILGFEVVALPDGSPAATLGLRLGDVLLGVDGVDASADMFLAEFTSRTMRDEGAVLVVRRAGARVELPARFDEERPARAFYGHGARFEARLR